MLGNGEHHILTNFDIRMNSSAVVMINSLTWYCTYGNDVKPRRCSCCDVGVS